MRACSYWRVLAKCCAVPFARRNMPIDVGGSMRAHAHMPCPRILLRTQEYGSIHAFAQAQPAILDGRVTD